MACNRVSGIELVLEKDESKKLFLEESQYHTSLVLTVYKGLIEKKKFPLPIIDSQSFRNLYKNGEEGRFSAQHVRDLREEFEAVLSEIFNIPVLAYTSDKKIIYSPDITNVQLASRLERCIDFFKMAESLNSAIIYHRRDYHPRRLPEEFIKELDKEKVYYYDG